MIVIYAGFDGLDLAIKAKPPLDLVEILEAGKTFAADVDAVPRATYNGLSFEVTPTVRKGGYNYVIGNFPMGAFWFFKKPRANDP